MQKKEKSESLSGKKNVEKLEGRKRESKESLYASISDVRSAIHSNRSVLVLLYKEACLSTNELDPSLPSSITSLLQEFADIFPEETSNGLPPIRGIGHHIDFVLGASIPNRPAYRCNLEETKEI